MLLYKMFNILIGSNVCLPLPEFENDKLPEARCDFRLFRTPILDPISIDWMHRWHLPNGRAWLAYARHDSGYLLHFPDIAYFDVCFDTDQIRCYPEPNVPIETISHLFLDQVIPLILSHWGKLVLHGSAVLTHKGAIVFVGESGQGKSTLTASFCQQGFSLLTDDCFLLEEEKGQILGVPSYPALRLWSDAVSTLMRPGLELSPVAHYTSKERVPVNGGVLSSFYSEPVPIHSLYILASPEQEGELKTINITPCSLQNAFMALVKYAFHLDIADQKSLMQAFDGFGRVIYSLKFYHLVFPRDFSFLPEVRKAILDNLAGV